MLSRRDFLILGAAGATASLGAGIGWQRWQEIPVTLSAPGKLAGHFLRDRPVLPEPTEIIDTEVVILGSGMAGLTAAWKLNKAGLKDFHIVSGPERHGNARAGRFAGLDYPTGAHYLPVPSTESFHVREILADLGIIVQGADSATPTYDERYLLHAPQERLLVNGRWQEGLIPTEAVPAQERAEQRRFFQEIERLRHLRDGQGKRIFTIPSMLSSSDANWQALDRLSFRDWMTQQGFTAPSLQWYVNYCCRDDFGARDDQVSAWAGLHYFCSRSGQASNAEDGAWLTWPGGLGPLADALDRAGGQRHLSGSAASLKKTPNGVEALCFELIDGLPHTRLVRAKTAICAMPLHVASRVVDNIAAFGFDPVLHTPAYSSWLVANFLISGFPAELPEAPLSWDNVVMQEPGLGYVVSTHQQIRVAPPPQTVFTAYVALSDRSPAQARQWLQQATPAALLALVSADLHQAYDWKLAACAEQVEITLRGHAMAIPQPGFRSNAGIEALRNLTGSILFAHADLSGFSVFEEAAWWGYRAAQLALQR